MLPFLLGPAAASDGHAKRLAQSSASARDSRSYYSSDDDILRQSNRGMRRDKSSQFEDRCRSLQRLQKKCRSHLRSPKWDAGTLLWRAFRCSFPGAIPCNDRSELMGVPMGVLFDRYSG